MTQLLISVKNVEEAWLALQAKADVIDLKDPSIGALGALDLHETERILQAVGGRALLSAAVGEQQVSADQLLQDIGIRAKLNVPIIKIAVSELIYTPHFFSELTKVINTGTKMVAVFFADEAIDFNLLGLLQKNGFYGAMLDTKLKQFSLPELQSKNTINRFVELCRFYGLKSGLSGSLKPQHIESLVRFNSSYIGFRGGVCENFQRKSALSLPRVIEVRNMLHEHNRLAIKPEKTLALALHS